MKKIITTLAITSVIAVAGVILTGCGGHQGVCDNCYKETTVYDYEATIFGYTQDASFCKDCTKEVKALGAELHKKY